ncbi:MAG: aminoacetone oxidase family FAD-binding enzyme [Mailhella sp.]|nr:aminoacetone oxidase family FAD-binding enzyme [Mailhella sp.]
MLYDVAIIGAGPAGLLCARNAARRGLRTALIDSHENPGVKLAIAGGGKGNITNRILDEKRYIGEDLGILRSALKAFSCNDALELMRELGLPWEERDFGQIFGLKSASIMAERLAIQCDDAGVDFYLGLTAKNIMPPDSSEQTSAPAFGRAGRQEYFTLFAGQEKITARQLVIAAGSPACPQLGASDQLARLASSWGHDVVPFRPVLVPLVMPERWPLAGLEGISLNVRLGLKDKDGLCWPDPEGIRSLLFTHRGVSGPAVLVASCWWKPGTELVIDFLPELPMLELLNEKEHGKLIVRTLLARRLPARLADALCPEDLARRKVAELGKKDRLRLAEIVHRFSVLPAGTEGLRRAEAAAGGIALSSLSLRLESLRVPGLYFCGEVVDIAGLLGGYNIHWAFASGVLVAKSLKQS